MWRTPTSSWGTSAASFSCVVPLVPSKLSCTRISQSQPRAPDDEAIHTPHALPSSVAAGACCSRPQAPKPHTKTSRGCAKFSCSRQMPRWSCLIRLLPAPSHLRSSASCAHIMRPAEQRRCAHASLSCTNTVGSHENKPRQSKQLVHAAIASVVLNSAMPAPSHLRIQRQLRTHHAPR